MADMHIKTGASTWKKVNGLYIKTGASTWKTVTHGYIKTGASTWKKFFSNTVVTLSGTSAFGLSNLGAGYKVDADGNCYTTTNGGSTWTRVTIGGDDNWIRPTTEASSAYSVRFTEFSSTGTWQYLLGGSLVDGTTWHTLGTDRFVVGNSTSSFVEAECTLTVEISDDGGSTILDSANINLSDEDLI